MPEKREPREGQQEITRWMKGEEKDQKINDIIQFTKDEIERFLNYGFRIHVNSGELGLIILLELKKDTINKFLDENLEKTEDKITFLKEVQAKVKEKLEEYREDCRKEEDKEKLLEEFLDSIKKEKEKISLEADQNLEKKKKAKDLKQRPSSYNAKEEKRTRAFDSKGEGARPEEWPRRKK